jgi:hypothetical protein
MVCYASAIDDVKCRIGAVATESWAAPFSTFGGYCCFVRTKFVLLLLVCVAYKSEQATDKYLQNIKFQDNG